MNKYSKIENENLKINFSFFYNLLSSFKIHFVGLLLVSIVWSVCTVLRNYALKLLIDNLAIHQVSFLLVWPMLLYFISWAGLESFLSLRDWIIIYLKPYLKEHVLIVFTRRINKYSEFFFQKNKSSELLNGLKNLYDGLDDAIYIVEELFGHVVLILSALISMYFINIKIGYITFIWIMIWLLIAYLFSRKAYKLSYDMHLSRSKLAFNLGDTFDNIIISKLCNGIDYENEKIKQEAREVALIEFKKEKLFFILWFLQGCSFFVVIGFVLYFLLIDFSKGLSTIGDFAMLINLIQGLYFYLFDLAKDLTELIETSGKINQGVDLLFQDLEKKLSIETEFNSNSFDIVFDKLKYKYDGQYNYSFDSDKKIEIKEGSFVALVGSSGSGKSTLMKLLIGLLTPTSGKIFIGGKDVGEYKEESLCKYFSFVPQNVGLFARTLKENIKYGTFDATDEEVYEAAKKACIHDFILTLKDGYNSCFGKDLELSGGQKQRILIARGLLRKSKIFIFDEPTSALDVKTESEILEAIQTSTDGLTRFIIAHRLHTIKSADLILVCEHGEIIEQGTHSELIALNGAYASMVKLI